MTLLTDPTQTLELAKHVFCLVSQKLSHTAVDDMIEKDILFTPHPPPHPNPPTTLTISVLLSLRHYVSVDVYR